MIVRAASVIVCTYNRADLLPRVISCLRAQDYPANAFEIIIVDNGSTDDTKQVVGRYAAESGAPVIYVLESRPGVTFARNRGAEEAHYPFLAYLDDDCSVHPDWLTQLMSGFALDESIAVVAGRIIVDFDQQERASWLSPKSEHWFGAYDHPGSHPRVLAEFPAYICEANMAIMRVVWESVGGFLGMDQFGNPHVAAQEIRIILKKIERQGGKVAFVPSAVVTHHSGLPTRRWLLKRAYMHGVSDAILDYLLNHFSGLSLIYLAVRDMTSMFIFFCLSLFCFLMLDKPTALHHLLRASARFGRILSELHLVGDWSSVQSWEATHR
jgi:glucosyl-dolichyl phosphate glucuronosyltransferase